MSVIINKRGIIKLEDEETETDSNSHIDKKQILDPVNQGTYNMTDIDEWNMKYNCNRISIEALNKIEIKKRGHGEEKKSFDKEYSEKVPGPYYDPVNNHIHIWKKDSLIPNFKSEQNPKSLYIEFTDYKKGTYCTICHIKNIKENFNWREEPDKDVDSSIYEIKCSDEYIEPLKKGEYKEFDNVTTVEKPKDEKNPIRYWEKLMRKVKYVINNDKIVYNVSTYRSLMLWPWEMTLYQKFKHNNKNYKNSCIFIDTDKKFRDKYVYIS